MNNKNIKVTLLAIWLIALLYCLIIVFIHYNDIPTNRNNFINQIFEVYSPQIATMLAFIFSDQFILKKKITINKTLALLSLTLSIIYVSFFCYIVTMFHLEVFKAINAIELIQEIRPKTLFLVTGFLAYYFASRK